MEPKISPPQITGAINIEENFSASSAIFIVLFKELCNIKIITFEK